MPSQSRSSAKSKSKKASRSDATQNAPTVPAVIEPAKFTDLDQLAERIRIAMRGVIKGATDALMAAMDAGDALNIAKKKVEHGKWMDWLEENCALSGRTARQYMQLSDAREIIKERIKNATEMAYHANFTLGVAPNFTITRALGWMKENRENVLSTSAKEKTTIGKEKRGKKYIDDATPEEVFGWLAPVWPSEKFIKLSELITAKFNKQSVVK